MNDQEVILLERFCGDLDLEIVFAGRGRVTLSSYSVTRPGLQLAGFFKYFDSTRILVFGNSEYEFLRSLPAEVRQERIRTLLSYKDIPCIILSRDLPVLHELIEEARKTACPIVRTDKVTTAIMNELFFYLNKKLAPQTSMHGVLMDVSGVGILLTGHSGIGKSETAMELIKRGHRLVADELTVSPAHALCIGIYKSTAKHAMVSIFKNRFKVIAPKPLFLKSYLHGFISCLK